MQQTNKNSNRSCSFNLRNLRNLRINLLSKPNLIINHPMTRNPPAWYVNEYLFAGTGFRYRSA